MVVGELWRAGGRAGGRTRLRHSATIFGGLFGDLFGDLVKGSGRRNLPTTGAWLFIRPPKVPVVGSPTCRWGGSQYACQHGRRSKSVLLTA